MLSALALMGLSDIHVMNGVKNVLATSINAVAAAVFVITDKVDWRLCLPMMASAIAGGFLGSLIAQRTSRTIGHPIVVPIAFSPAASYFFPHFPPPPPIIPLPPAPPPPPPPPTSPPCP